MKEHVTIRIEPAEVGILLREFSDISKSAPALWDKLRDAAMQLKAPSRLQQVRTELGLSPTQMAKEMGLSLSYLSIVESGKRIPPPSFYTLIETVRTRKKNP